jgi:exosome complex RNA-binding protein Csl4
MTCQRCGDPMERRTILQTRCLRCEAEVARLIAADAKRRTPRWGRAKELTWA